MPQIFIVDDSISVRKALEITLRNNAMQSSSAISGEQAWEMLESGDQTVDLMMVDVIMPGMSGLELCQKVKTDPRFSHLPLILMSGNVDDDVRAEAREAGADGVLKKPFRSEELIPMVQSVLEEAQAKQPAAPAAATPAAEPAAIHENEAHENEAAAPAEAISNSDLDALSHLLQTYEDHPRVRDVVILDRQGHPIRQTGNVLPDNIQMFAKFFTNTAGVLGKQMLGEDISDITIRYGAHEMVVHNLPGHFVIVLMGEGNGLQA